jgi:phage/plasmid-associated DNA primase
MGIPSTVVEATAEYRKEEDEIGEFISERCFDYGRCDRKLLYAAYKDWTGMGGTKFPLKLSRHRQHRASEAAWQTLCAGKQRFWSKIALRDAVF